MQPTTITDVRTIGVTVSNQDDAVEFYVATLGFEKRLDAAISPTMRWIEVAPAGATTSIALEVGDGATKAGVDTGIRFTVPDAEAEHAAMLDRGMKVGDVLRWDGVPAMYTFDDPDGNRFYIVEDVVMTTRTSDPDRQLTAARSTRRSPHPCRRAPPRAVGPSS